MQTLTKKQKADIFAWLVNSGFWNYFDVCHYVPSQHKYRYECADEDHKVYYVTQKEFADNWDSVLDDEEREQYANEYFDDMEVAKVYGTTNP